MDGMGDVTAEQTVYGERDVSADPTMGEVSNEGVEDGSTSPDVYSDE